MKKIVKLTVKFPKTMKIMERAKIIERMLKLAEKAGVKGCDWSIT